MNNIMEGGSKTLKPPASRPAPLTAFVVYNRNHDIMPFNSNVLDNHAELRNVRFGYKVAPFKSLKQKRHHYTIYILILVAHSYITTASYEL